LRFHVRALSSLTAAAAMTVATAATAAHADPRTVVVEEFVVPESIDASPDGRAWLRSAGTSLTFHAVIVGPGDAVTRLPLDTPSPFAMTAPPPPGRLTLAADGTLLADGVRAPLSDELLRSLGLRTDRRALAYDAARDRYALVRSRRPLATHTGYEDVWSLVWFTTERVVAETEMPNERVSQKPPLAASGGVAWLGTSTGVLRWQDGEWTELGDADLIAQDRANRSRDRRDLYGGFALFTLGGAASSALFALPVSSIGQQRYLPTATTTFVGAFPGMFAAGMFGIATHGDSGVFSSFLSFVTVTLGVLSIPAVAFGTWATGEAAFRGTKNDGAFFGALGGAASGALVWTLASSLIPDKAFEKGWYWLVPLGGGFISASSTTGYLWAGKGFAHY
jgi:hypothetical protein